MLLYLFGMYESLLEWTKS
uniref:Uncharacterized protein n=1 Tax=Lepeophtheirus salmonis TaxID=72036 RepID=A0A0K2U6G8_LEPSM